MSRKRTLIGTSVCFVAVLYGLLLVSTFQPQLRDAGYDVTSPDISLYLSNIEFRSLKDLQTYFEDFDLKAPSLVSFLKASTTEVNQNLNFNGLAVVSNLTDACQPLVDVAKARVRVNKIAFIQIMTESATACSLCELAVKAQNAGYSMVIFPSLPPSKLLEGNCSVKTVDKLLIPVVVCIRDYFPRSPPPQVTLDSMLSHAHQSDVHIRVSLLSNDLETMAKYLENLYIWFLVGPIITLVWLRRNKILCCVTTVRLVDDESSNEEIMGECPRDYIHQALIFTNHTQTSTIIVRLARIFGRSIRYLALGLGYVILTLAPLPVGISSGGLSFFRFDVQERYRQKTFWDVLLPEENKTVYSNNNYNFTFSYTTPGAGHWLTEILTVWWPVLRIFSFFMYSKFVCKRTWTVSTHLPKLIRSDWFSSNMCLLVLSVVVPYCSLSQTRLFNFFAKLIYFTVYNSMCTVCNFLFIILLNKHKVVTRYVFFISVCMICAYLESDIVAVFYFILNSQGALNNLKLTALRTLALGLTLTLSFSTSMHIIRKLMKPQESVFEGVSQR